VASLKAIRDAIKATLEGIEALAGVYDTMPDATNLLPCVVVMPSTADFTVAMGRGTDRYDFTLCVMVSPIDKDLGQDALDDLVTGAGDSSIRQTIFAARTLGLAGVDAHVSAMTAYGGQFEGADIDHIGAALSLVVTTPGTS
jgi:hypothetical protein